MDPGWAELADDLLHGWGAIVDEDLDEDDGFNLEDFDHLDLEASAGSGQNQIPQAAVLRPSELQIPVRVQEAMAGSSTSPWMPTPLMSFFDQVLLHGPDLEPNQQQTLDQGLSKNSSMYCNADTQLHTSKVAVGQLAGIAAEAVEPCLNLLSNTFIHLDQHNRTQMLEHILNFAAEMILFLDVCCYDDTPPPAYFP